MVWVVGKGLLRFLRQGWESAGILEALRFTFRTIAKHKLMIIMATIGLTMLVQALLVSSLWLKSGLRPSAFLPGDITLGPKILTSQLNIGVKLNLLVDRPLFLVAGGSPLDSHEGWVYTLRIKNLLTLIPLAFLIAVHASLLLSAYTMGLIRVKGLWGKRGPLWSGSGTIGALASISSLVMGPFGACHLSMTALVGVTLGFGAGVALAQLFYPLGLALIAGSIIYVSRKAHKMAMNEGLHQELNQGG